MKKKNVLKKLGYVFCITALCVNLCGCGEKQEDTKNEIVSEESVEDAIGNGSTENDKEKDTSAENEDTNETETEENVEETAESDAIDYEFLSQYRFEFSSGAGGWSTELLIHADGTFEGQFHDSEMGSTGEGYPNGSMYFCEFSGSFKGLTKIDEYSYDLKLDHVDFKDPVGSEEILDGVRYIYTDWYGPEGTDHYKVLIPGAPYSLLNEEEQTWVMYQMQEDGELCRLPLIVNEEKHQVFYSYEKLSPYEEASAYYEMTKETFDAIAEEGSESLTTLEMTQNSRRLYDTADECLNYVWSILKNNLPKDTYEAVLNEQRTWIKEKEQKGEDAANENGGGTLAPIEKNVTLADETMARIEVLLQYLKDCE